MKDAQRDPGLDGARAVAVLSMLWVHFVPYPEQILSVGDELIAWSLAALDGLPAALFLLLVGTSAQWGGVRPWPYVARRAVGIASIGLPFWWFVWPNDVLLPIAASVLAVYAVQRLGALMTWVLVIAMLMMVPVATELWGDYVWYVDIREDGTHIANHSFGWHTLRYFLFDGAYPLLPWLCFPWIGVRLGDGLRNTAGRRRWTIGACLACFIAVAVDHLWGDAWAGGVYEHLDITWQPTSIPFVMAWGGAAVLVVLACRSCAGVLSERMIHIGRLSLTHYLLHTVVVYGGLRLMWPLEDWPVGVGVAVACGYGAIAWFGSRAWGARFGRGPVEEVLHRWSRWRR